MMMLGKDAFQKARALGSVHHYWPAVIRADFLRNSFPEARRRAQSGLTGLLGKSGALEVRLARSAADIRRAQRLRYEVFYDELAAQPGVIARLTRHDADRFDACCDHIIVTDSSVGPKGRVVGAYRLLRQDVAARHGGFYSQDEFRIDTLVARHPELRFLELGRSCVLKEYRDKRTVELLWQAIYTYVRHHRIDAMFGCASFHGVDAGKLALPLSFLAHHARADEAWRVAAAPERAVAMNILPSDAVDARLALRTLPALIKGYLRLGAWFGEHAVIDRAFNTTDVLVVLPVSRIDPRYIDYFSEEAGRFAA
ncbi:MAG: GNAT family N-acetyltransferase [Rhizobiales bacterium]|nr:GNAT family N-acetyltransferase [Hyphomicrobiales bacterium]